MGPVGTDSNSPAWISSARLADGREIIYFDEAPDLGRALASDTRPLPPRSPGPPGPVGSPEQGIRWDPLAGEWVVIAAARQGRPFLPPADHAPLGAAPLGRCEVVFFTADHYASFAQLTPRRVRTVLEAWVNRTEVLGALPETRQVYCFENRGEEIGVTLRHPHGQIYAFPFVAPRLERMVAQAHLYQGGNLFDDLVAAELRAGTRIVART